MLLVSGCIRSYSLAWAANPISRRGVIVCSCSNVSFVVVAWLLVVAAEE